MTGVAPAAFSIERVRFELTLFCAPNAVPYQIRRTLVRLVIQTLVTLYLIHHSLEAL